MRSVADVDTWIRRPTPRQGFGYALWGDVEKTLRAIREEIPLFKYISICQVRRYSRGPRDVVQHLELREECGAPDETKWVEAECISKVNEPTKCIIRCRGHDFDQEIDNIMMNMKLNDYPVDILLAHDDEQQREDYIGQRFHRKKAKYLSGHGKRGAWYVRNATTQGTTAYTVTDLFQIEGMITWT